MRNRLFSITLCIFTVMTLGIGCDDSELKPKARIEVSFVPSSTFPQQSGANYIWNYDLQIEELTGIDVLLETVEFSFYDRQGIFERSITETCSYIDSHWLLDDCLMPGGESFIATNQMVARDSPDAFTLILTLSGEDEFKHQISASAEFTGHSD
jgi:hypothetical protein